jgi:hypothetical protein
MEYLSQPMHYLKNWALVQWHKDRAHHFHSQQGSIQGHSMQQGHSNSSKYR